MLQLWGFPDMGDAGFVTVYDAAIADSASSLGWLEICGCGITAASLSTIAGLSGLEGLALWENDIADISALVTLSHLNNLWLGGNQIHDLAPLRALHEAGGLAVREGWDHPDVYVDMNGLDLTPGTPNREVIDYLLNNGVNVEWEPQE
jgi:Leucine-rich repeat (LRR) protein